MLSTDAQDPYTCENCLGLTASLTKTAQDKQNTPCVESGDERKREVEGIGLMSIDCVVELIEILDRRKIVKQEYGFACLN